MPGEGMAATSQDSQTAATCNSQRDGKFIDGN